MCTRALLLLQFLLLHQLLQYSIHYLGMRGTVVAAPRTCRGAMASTNVEEGAYKAGSCKHDPQDSRADSEQI
jgi:hypothetical protein